MQIDLPTFHEVVGKKWFHILVVPFFLVALGVFARRLGRRDGDTTPRRNDWAVGTNVVLMTFGAIAADLRNVFFGSARTDVAALFGWLLFFVAVTYVSIDHDRYGSWERDSDAKPTSKKSVLRGIVIPDAVSILLFAVYQAAKVMP